MSGKMTGTGAKGVPSSWQRILCRFGDGDVVAVDDVRFGKHRGVFVKTGDLFVVTTEGVILVGVV
jgi:hypothetical protein